MMFMLMLSVCGVSGVFGAVFWSIFEWILITKSASSRARRSRGSELGSEFEVKIKVKVKARLGQIRLSLS